MRRGRPADCAGGRAPRGQLSRYLTGVFWLAIATQWPPRFS